MIVLNIPAGMCVRDALSLAESEHYPFTIDK